MRFNQATDSPAGLGGGIQRRQSRPITIDLNSQFHADRLRRFLHKNDSPIMSGVIVCDAGLFLFSCPTIHECGDFLITGFNVDGDTVHSLGFVFSDYGFAGNAHDTTFRLSQLTGYDVTALRKSLQSQAELLKELQQRFDALEGASLTDAIDNVREIEAFLAGIADTETLTGLLTELYNKVKAEVGTIPTALSQLENDNHTVTDEHYVHTDNNLTDELKQKAEGAMEKFTTSGDLTLANGKLAISEEFNERKADKAALSNVLARTAADTVETVKAGGIPQAFIDIYNSAFGDFGKFDPEHAPDAEHPFYGNELWMTYEEAVKVVALTIGARNTTHLSAAFTSMVVKTHVPFVTKTKSEQGIMLESAFRGSSMEVINLTPIDNTNAVTRIKGATLWIFQAPQLRKVLGVIEFVDASPAWNGTQDNLEEIRITNLKKDLDIRTCRKISLESIQFAVTNAANTSAITITVHADIMAKLADETNIQWHAVLTAAAEKNISFAS